MEVNVGCILPREQSLILGVCAVYASKSIQSIHSTLFKCSVKSDLTSIVLGVIGGGLEDCSFFSS